MTRARSVFVARTVTVVDGKQNRPKPLEEFRSVQAYVLLGDPGAGKTRAFDQECKEDLRGEFVTARQFIRKSPARVSQWAGRTLFIDGLDEARAAGADPRRPLDLILERLENLPNPRFRISCRAADWLGSNDLQGIVSEIGYGDVRVLHLDPLTDRDIQEILIDLGESDSRAFVDEARQQGLEGLLDNPQLLGLLVKATQDGKWPADRSGVLELACRKLAKERNDEHRAARRADPPVPGNRIVAAAGHLSVLLLMSDRDRVSLDASEDPTVISLEDVADGDQAALVKAVKSNLFAGRQDGGFEVVHRLISEFLAARFLHDQIESGVPAGRVLALMAGGDGVVVDELRGLAAWLAAFDRTSRPRLVETDPVGVALYGDASRFSGDDIEHLLGAFAGRPHEVQLSLWPAAALSSLVGNRSVGLLLGYLGDDDRTLGRQTVAGLLLRVLSSSPVPIHSRKAIEDTVRDATWHPNVRRAALHALCRHSRDDQTRIPVPLIVDLLEGKVDDRDGELVEMLWRIDGEILFDLLDSLVERGASFPEDRLDKRGWVIGELVQRAIRARGEDVPVSTLYNWLELIGPLRALEPQSQVTEWMKERPALLKKLANEVWRRSFQEGERGMNCDRSEGSKATVSDSQTEIALLALFRCRPGDFGEWCLEQAIERAEASVEVARMLLEWSLPWHDGDRDWGLALDDVRRSTEGVPELRREVDLLWEGQILSDARGRNAMARSDEKREEYASERRRRKDKFIAYVRDNAAELRQARCLPELLHKIAIAYHNRVKLADGRITPWLRVVKHLGGQVDLADAAFEGFRSVVEREDLPTLRDVIRLDEQEKMSVFALPLLAGFDLMTPERAVSRSPAEIARAAALYYVAHHYYRANPDWYRRALKHHREAVAEALIKVTSSRVRKGRECLYLRDLAQDGSCRGLARMATLSLLRTFPTRCTESQVSALRHVLVAGLKWKVEGIDGVVQRLAAKDSLDVAQRSQWLAAGLFLSPESYTPQIQRFLEDGEEARSRNVVEFLSSATAVMTVKDAKRLSIRWPTRTLRTMIELLGSRYSPWRPEGRKMVQTVDANRESVKALISQWATALASRTDRDAVDALRSLVNDPKLEPWHLVLAEQRTQQVVARRSATFAAPDLDAVQKALADAEPANLADLAALVVDRLEQLGREISHGNTDDWRQFWNEGPHRHPTGPKHEESCRDVLLSDLRHLLPAGVDAQPEARYARGKRSDIRISFDRHAIPVEVKRDSHAKLWSAVADQLAPKYASAPESAGFGVYLVLWFGQGNMHVPPVGRCPKTPEALRDRLQDQLTGPHRHEISVVVLDVSGSAPGTS